jgi:hypothetical protein
MKQRNDNLLWTRQELAVIALGIAVLLTASWIVI